MVGEFEVGFENGIGEVGEFDERIKPSHLTWSRSKKLESDPRVLTREPSAANTTAITAASTSSSSPSWFPAIFAGRMKKKSQFLRRVHRGEKASSVS